MLCLRTAFLFPLHLDGWWLLSYNVSYNWNINDLTPVAL